ncbi:NCS2 family permease [Nocardioides daejeonensis]|uniref:NCS2 family permease n=1 Tax=Nocardioides daejeonensis TaxID=1046556 RepID=UPI000D748E25|nr:NCS2 family permease [Nocardioides daejeonensis]
MSTKTSAAPSRLDAFFKISERGSTVARELRGGLVTFLTMAYILVLNPLILIGAPDKEGNFLAGGDTAVIAACTALVAGVLCIVMGLVANFPLALAAGLGLNAFVTYSVANQMTWADAMGLVVIEGLVILALVLTGFREAVFNAVPAQLKIAISVGIGLFITLIGLVDAGFIRRGGGTPVEMGIGGQLQGWPVLVFALGLVLLITLYTRGVRGAILISIIAATVLAIIVEKIAEVGPTVTGFDQDGAPIVNPTGWNLNVPAWPDKIVDKPDFGLLGEFSLLGSWENVGVVTVFLLIFTLLLTDFFDTMGTMTAVGAEAGLLDEDGNPPRTKQILIVDSIAAAAGGAASVSSNTSYIESTSGVADGARTGLAAISTGVLFLLATFLAPIVKIVPNEAAVPALVLVGFLMMQQVKGIDWDDLEIAIPAFLTIVLMPFAYSISAGIGAGFLAYVLIKVVRGKASEIHALMWIIAVLFVVYFAIHPLTAWLT